MTGHDANKAAVIRKSYLLSEEERKVIVEALDSAIMRCANLDAKFIALDNARARLA